MERVSRPPNAPLDSEIQKALARLHSAGNKPAFDVERYRLAFAASAREKAQVVLESLRSEKFFPLPRRPVFVSIGGADGEELDFLLQNSEAAAGVLIEALHPLAEYARHRSLPSGKSIEVFEGDAQEMLGPAMAFADNLIRSREADCKVVTCHAVIHELYDRGRERFNPVIFFAEIFNDDSIPTWFTYREPGVPSTWPDEVLLSAHCSPGSLEQLGQAILEKHPSFSTFLPKPKILGNQRLLVNGHLAMEILAKLFYLDDLLHEIEERSTSIDHRVMINALMLTIDDQAMSENRAAVQTSRAASDSFSSHWQASGIRMWALKADNSIEPLAIAESHVRLVAWRSPPPIASAEDRDDIAAPSESQASADLLLAEKVFRSGDRELLEALLVSNGRAWIEGKDRARALLLLRSLKEKFSCPSLAWLWSHYLLSIASLFSGKDISRADFSDEIIEAVGPTAVALLFRAEKMEFARKSADRSVAVNLANQLLKSLARKVEDKSALSNLQAYVRGTSHFLLANLLRHGGLYREAQGHISLAEEYLRPGVAAHDTELAHCYYGRSVCYAMQGFASFEPPVNSRSDDFLFANGLIHLAQSNAAWFLNDFSRAYDYAMEAARRFDRVEAYGYTERARTIAGLLRRWMVLEGREVGVSRRQEVAPKLDSLIDVITGASEDYGALSDWIRDARPSVALGILQFETFRPTDKESVKLFLPLALQVDSRSRLHWVESRQVNSIGEASRSLRRILRVPEGQKVPLIPD
jgi:hypothetical protein